MIVLIYGIELPTQVYDKLIKNSEFISQKEKIETTYNEDFFFEAINGQPLCGFVYTILPTNTYLSINKSKDKLNKYIEQTNEAYGKIFELILGQWAEVIKDINDNISNDPKYKEFKEGDFKKLLQEKYPNLILTESLDMEWIIINK